MATFVTKERDPGSATVRDTKGETESGGSTWEGEVIFSPVRLGMAF